MDIAILTSDDVRHRYFVNAIRARHNVVAVGYQDTRYVPKKAADAPDVDEATARTVRHHFDERKRQEANYFGHDAEFIEHGLRTHVHRFTTETLNTPETAEFLRGAGSELVLIYGTSLIKAPLLDAFAGRMVNMHLGLSPYYRGTATNFYPLVNDEPEYVGATIHLIDAGIDSGDILYHARPEITADDMPHTVGCKAILAGIEKVHQAIQDFETESVHPVRQWDVPNARLYLRKDYHPSQVARLYELIEDGLFPRYVERRADVEHRMMLIDHQQSDVSSGV
jgi:methionyl-tRNA formyltransferase